MTTDKKYVETPLMKQYYAIKEVHKDAILLFRVGDFYETFGDDAIKTSSILGITLTRRANGAASFVELAGFPYHSVDTYLPKLVRAGERVAICEQLEDPKATKNIVKRGVVELITPGVALGDNILSTRENTFLGAVYFGRNSTGVSLLDISTGEFYAAQGSSEYVDKLLSNFAPKEIIYERGHEADFHNSFGTKHYTYKLDEWGFTEDLSRQRLCKQFEVKTLKGYGIEEMGSAISAAGAILYYLEFTEHKDIKHINSISRINEDHHVWIDRFTMRNLELFSSGRDGDGRSFAGVIDKTLSPMGSRLLKRWIAMPIRDVSTIDQRLDVVGRFKDDEPLREAVCKSLGEVGDLERIVSRIAAMRVTPRELVQLKNSLYALERLKGDLVNTNDRQLSAIGEKIELAIDVRQKIEREIYPDPTNQIVKGGVVADGVNLELDDLRRISNHGKELITKIQQRESEATGIPSLKVSFNNVFGYYIEVRNGHKDKVPPGWIRKQTLTSAERYITAELKEYEEKIFGAQEKILHLEQQIYSELLASLMPHLVDLQQSAGVVARLDCLVAFAIISAQRGYCRPTVDESLVIDIKGGRHPVIETLMSVGESYVPNDVYLDNTTQQVMMITGPNMSGKSALLRQTALIVLMAQIGCYVPATAAHIGIVDKIFTRVGASDNISQGESTFMVEMLESATILNNLSNRSLLLLDEIGRGTSTYDGISIAWAIVEYIHNHPTRAKTLFATHYHELNEMESLCSRIKNYNVSVREVGRTVVFMRKLVAGGTHHSFGIHVAKMAGMPRKIVDRAGEMLKTLEQTHRNGGNSTPDMGGLQLSMFQLDDPVLEQIRDHIKGLDINNLTPIEALNKLSEIKKITGI